MSCASRVLGLSGPWLLPLSVVAGLAVAPCLLVRVANADDKSVPARGDRALIVVGLPGDQEHEVVFRETATAWRGWLADSLRFPVDGLRVLFGEQGQPGLSAGPATREAITTEAEAIRRALLPDGRLWVFVLGHANEREGHAYLHLPGPDLRDDELAALFKGIVCREQVFWMTTANSGWFLPSLSAQGRVVVTATTRDREPNETEFPHVLAEICRQGLKDLDADGDGKVSLWEIFVKTSRAVEARFAADNRAPTEHALLDDNGDKRGTEAPADAGPGANAGAAGQKSDERAARDGGLARKTFVPTSIP